MIPRLFACLAIAAALAPAALQRIELSERSDVLAGRAFGNSGPYERLVGKAFFAIDPKNPANQIISDIGKAPRNEDGLVEFSSDLYVLKPRDPAKGNGSALFEVSNRGNKGMLAMYNRGPASLDPRAAEHFGDNFLLDQGYTLVWLGWQFDVPRKDGLLRLYAPAIEGLTGLVRAEFVPDAKTSLMPLSDRNHLTYPVVKPGELTVRDHIDSPRRTIPADEWKVVNGTEIASAGSFEPGKIYEFAYTSKDPVLVGAGPAAVRDFISFLKYGAANDTVLNDQKRFIKRSYGFGVSQSGRFLRKFLYDGFNADEQKRKVFDGVLAHVAGAGRGSFNHRFAQPSRDGHPFMNMLYPTDMFPFTDLDETDPETGTTDGLLDHAVEIPKIFYTNSSYEYWGRAASLTHMSPDAKKDAPLPDSTRIYFFAGGQHGPAAFPPPQHHTQNASDPDDYRWNMRALLVAMDTWVKEGTPPPVSQYPKVGDDKLVALGAIQFPKIPGVAFPSRPQRAWHSDFGPEFQKERVVTIDPPKVGKPFAIMLPQVDRDGNDLGGIRMPEVAVPLATYTGWNLRSPEIGAPDELFSMQGSFIPFPKTKAERERKHDPRLSIAERYASRQEYLAKVSAAANDLVKNGYLLDRDVPKVIERSALEWDTLTAGAVK
ncbi:MAG: alpha/beta hydrolase domain-containing protein [Acidobacteriota bacterium]|nr:alpha/beta hydrolase domain-containing protein [Acidobacteriota bacterium]